VEGSKDTTFVQLLSRPIIQLSYALTAVTMFGMFILIPNISAYVQHNLGYPREGIGTLYLVGGVVSFVLMRVVGTLVDKFGAVAIGSAGALMVVVVTYLGFYRYPPAIGVLVMFVCFMASTSFRAVPYNLLTSQVPAPHERARFMSFQSAVQHISSAIAGFMSALILTEEANQSLGGMHRVAAVTMAANMLLPALLWALQKQLSGIGHTAPSFDSGR
jgi:predicted MFS family arabinose efflux permease